RHQRDVTASEFVWITAPVPTLVVMLCADAQVSRKIEIRSQERAEARMFVQDEKLRRRRLARAIQDGFGHEYLADIMQHARVAELLQPRIVETEGASNRARDTGQANTARVGSGARAPETFE